MLLGLPLLLLASQPLTCSRPEGGACVAPEPARLEAQGAMLAEDPLGRGTWVLDDENDELVLMPDRHRIKTGRWPAQLVVAHDGRVFITCRDSGELDVVDTHFELKSIPLGPEPKPLALDETNGRLYVGLVTSRQLVSFDAKTLEPLNARSLDAPPDALALLPNVVAVGSRRSSTVTLLPRSLEGPELLVPLGSASQQTVGVDALVGAGDDLIIVAQRARTGTPEPSGGYGGSSFVPFDSILFVVREPSGGYRLPEMRHVFQAPDVVGAVYRDGMLYIASRGLGMVDAVALSPDMLLRSPVLRVDVGKRTEGLALANDGSLLVLAGDARELRRYARPEKVERVLKTHAGRGEQDDDFERDLLQEVLGQLPGLDAPISSALPPSRVDPELRLGRRLFHDVMEPAVSTRGLACASCHVDGREDGRVWQLQGTRRQTPMLSGRLEDTAPFNWLGTAKTLEDNVQLTITGRLNGEGLPPKQLRALSRYLREGLHPARAPAVEHAELVALGDDVFHRGDTGCATCHPSDGAFSDGVTHDVGSLSKGEARDFAEAIVLGQMRRRRHHWRERSRPDVQQQMMSAAGRPDTLPVASRAPRDFDTPTLRSVALTAPYFHDGSSPSLEALIEDNADRMGNTTQLTAHERDALIAYLRTL